MLYDSTKKTQTPSNRTFAMLKKDAIGLQFDKTLRYDTTAVSFGIRQHYEQQQQNKNNKVVISRNEMAIFN